VVAYFVVTDTELRKRNWPIFRFPAKSHCRVIFLINDFSKFLYDTLHMFLDKQIHLSCLYLVCPSCARMNFLPGSATLLDFHIQCHRLCHTVLQWGKLKFGVNNLYIKCEIPSHFPHSCIKQFKVLW